MDDDFNSAAAFATIHDLVGEGNRTIEAMQGDDQSHEKRLDELVASFLEMTSTLGFGFQTSAVSSELIGPLVDYLLELREGARAGSDFELADRIRSRLEQNGIAVEDTPEGARWHLKAAED
jgi:cysteinyl-tRNA synthetase